MSLAAGTSLGRYVITGPIGAGGMGEVYRARDSRLSRDVAIKVLAPDLASDAAAVARFEREAVAASALNHPHIMHVYDVGRERVGGEEVLFIAMELVDGRTLRAEIARDGDRARLLRVLTQVGDALARAHEAGIVHRDLKPENVMITADGYAKVLDFGLAKLAAPATSRAESLPTEELQFRTSAGVVVGTAGYMAPEQATGQHVDHRADIFSFGCVLYEIATGAAPFRGLSTIDTLHRVLYDQPNYTAIGEPLQGVVRRCLAKNPGDRYATMDEVLAALRPAAERQGSSPSQPKKRSAQISSIAVLPFLDESHDPDTEYLSEGITETLISSLSQIPKLRVVPRSTVFRYRGRDDVAAIARDLNVGAVLSGRVVHRPDRIVIAAELVDTVNDAQLWGEQYSRPASDLLELQKAIADDIARQLRPKLSRQTQKRVIKIHTEDPVAYQLYLKGRYHLNKRSAAALRKSIEYFQQAIDRDPAYARGYAGLADAWVLLGWYAVERPRQAFPRALAAARQAVAIDSSYAEAHTSVAYATFLGEWDVDRAEKEFEKAIALNPDYPVAHHWYADLLQATGRAKEAIAEAERACQLDPLALILNAEAGRAHYYDRAFGRAIEQQLRTLDLEPDFAPALLFLGQAYDQSGHPAEAVQVFQRGVDVSQRNPIYLGYLGYALARAGDRAGAGQIREELQTKSAAQWIPAFALGLIAMALGERDDAHSQFENAFAERSHWLLYAKVDPAFDALWRDEAFAAIRNRTAH